MQAELEPQDYEKLLAESVDVVAVLNPAGVIQYQSPSTQSVLGYDPEELVGESVFEYIHPDDRADAVETFERLVDTETEHTTETVELRFKRADDSWIWLESRASNQSLDGVGGYVVNSREITALKQREAELEQTRELLQNTERIADVGGWAIDTETQEVFWTEHLFELLGWPSTEEPPLEEALDVYHEDDRPAVEAAVEDALATGEAFDVEARFHRDDGALRWLRVQGLPTVEDGEVVALRGAVQDITERKRREQELEQYQTIVEASGDPVYTLDETGQFTSVNEALVDLSGYDEAELLGAHASILIPQEHVERSEAAIRSLLDSQSERTTVRMDLVTAEGEHVPCETHLALLPFEDEFRGTVGIIRDISERVEREQQIERERDRLEEFASVASHDLRNPLSVAKGRIEMAQEECASDHLSSAANAIDRSLALVDDLLTLARDGEQISSTETVDLAEFVRQAWQTVDTGDATLVVETERQLDADRSRLQQVVENLIRNAVEHGGDAVTITVGDLDDGFYVEDDGSGIDPDEREAVFDVGYSTASGGTGFGLNIVREIVDAHGWAIDVTDGATGGARFEITGLGGAAE